MTSYNAGYYSVDITSVPDMPPDEYISSELITYGARTGSPGLILIGPTTRIWIDYSEYGIFYVGDEARSGGVGMSFFTMFCKNRAVFIDR